MLLSCRKSRVLLKPWGTLSSGHCHGKGDGLCCCSYLFTCCSLRVTFIAERFFWHIWQKNNPFSSRFSSCTDVPSLPNSCCRTKATAASLSVAGSPSPFPGESTKDLWRQASPRPLCHVSASHSMNTRQSTKKPESNTALPEMVPWEHSGNCSCQTSIYTWHT